MPLLQQKETIDFLTEAQNKWDTNKEYADNRKAFFDYYDSEIKKLDLRILVDLGSYMKSIHQSGSSLKSKTYFDRIRVDSSGNENINTTDWLTAYKTLKAAIITEITNEEKYPLVRDKHPINNDYILPLDEIFKVQLKPYNPLNWFRNPNSYYFFTDHCVAVSTDVNELHSPSYTN